MQLFAPAKINFYLHIVGKRPDGFHDLETLMVPISLGDQITLARTAKGISLRCSDPELPADSSNLAWRAAQIFLETFAVAGGVAIDLEKRVPSGAGLGGGSSDAATVLLGLRDLYQVSASDAQLAELAAQLGSDIPFFIYRTAAVCRGRGEIVEPVQLRGDYHGLLVHPGFGVPTPWAYKTYAQSPTRGELGQTFPDGALRNDLEPPVFSKYLWLPTAKAWFQSQPGVLDALMSGSGSSLFALVADPATLPALAAAFRAAYGPESFVAEFTPFAAAQVSPSDGAA